MSCVWALQEVFDCYIVNTFNCIYSLTVEFNVGSPSSGDYGTKESVYPHAYYIKQCSGKIKEGDVDTGWVYSPKAKNPTQEGEGFLKAYVEKNNNLFHACSISYNWYYYN